MNTNNLSLSLFIQKLSKLIISLGIGIIVYCLVYLGIILIKLNTYIPIKTKIKNNQYEILKYGNTKIIGIIFIIISIILVLIIFKLLFSNNFIYLNKIKTIEKLNKIELLSKINNSSFKNCKIDIMGNWIILSSKVFKENSIEFHQRGFLIKDNFKYEELFIFPKILIKDTTLPFILENEENKKYKNILKDFRILLKKYGY